MLAELAAANAAFGEEQVESIEASIASQIDAEKNPTQEAGVPW